MVFSFPCCPVFSEYSRKKNKIKKKKCVFHTSTVNIIACGKLIKLSVYKCPIFVKRNQIKGALCHSLYEFQIQLLFFIVSTEEVSKSKSITSFPCFFSNNKFPIFTHNFSRIFKMSSLLSKVSSLLSKVLQSSRQKKKLQMVHCRPVLKWFLVSYFDILNSNKVYVLHQTLYFLKS